MACFCRGETQKPLLVTFMKCSYHDESLGVCEDCIEQVNAIKESKDPGAEASGNMLVTLHEWSHKHTREFCKVDMIEPCEWHSKMRTVLLNLKEDKQLSKKCNWCGADLVEGQQHLCEYCEDLGKEGEED